MPEGAYQDPALRDPHPTPPTPPPLLPHPPPPPRHSGPPAFRDSGTPGPRHSRTPAHPAPGTPAPRHIVLLRLVRLGRRRWRRDLGVARPAVAAGAGHLDRFVRFAEVLERLVEAGGRFDHQPGHFVPLLRGVGEVVGRPGLADLTLVTEHAVHVQRRVPVLHQLDQRVGRDVLGQDLDAVQRVGLPILQRIGRRPPVPGPPGAAGCWADTPPTSPPPPVAASCIARRIDDSLQSTWAED